MEKSAKNQGGLSIYRTHYVSTPLNSQVPWLGTKVEQEMVLRVRSAQIQRFPY